MCNPLQNKSFHSIASKNMIVYRLRVLMQSNSAHAPVGTDNGVRERSFYSGLRGGMGRVFTRPSGRSYTTAAILDLQCRVNSAQQAFPSDRAMYNFQPILFLGCCFLNISITGGLCSRRRSYSC
ncbi:hypothetical protein XELAEV_18020254mg [Xenopus laevis]|uniref:Uncharacterized protein n=1 Tax=Xenopus laevis TaxID=8355 RepID=A0A974HQG7_XENLA|nr:hypothetical protein XELAEV_18020254mg [Xenopus laevis]